MTVIRRDGLTWVAPRDGLAHATENGALRTLCGAMPTVDRFAWPIREMCRVCGALEKGLTAARKRGKVAATA